tara:strand:+ start:69 stop:269 length:201 start_codon:yes stop_codon:yes gene_type:complete
VRYSINNKKGEKMNIEITNGEKIILLVAIKEAIRLVEENPNNSPDALNSATKSKVEGLYKKVKEAA